MKVNFHLNEVYKSIHVEPGQNVQKLLQELGVHSVRNSDDQHGFAGSDTILLDGNPVNASLLVAGQLEGRHVESVESLSSGRSLSEVQSAMVDAGIVQSGYNSPATALLMTDLLKRAPNPSRDEIIDAFSGLFNRATGYQQFFTAVELAIKRRNDESYLPAEIAEEFREDLAQVGKVRRKVDAPKLVAGRPAFVEDMVRPGACIMKMLRSPHAHAVITSIETKDAEEMPGVHLVLTHKNTPKVWYSQAGQGFPEPSPYDRRLFGRKVLHVGDRVAAVVADSEDLADEALGRIKVEYKILPKIMQVEEAEREDAPILHKAELSYATGAPENLEEINKAAREEDGEILYQFPIGADPHRNIAASVSGGIGSVDEGFAAADVVIDRTYRSSHIQCTPLETHTVYTRMDGERLVIHASTQVPWHLRRIVARVLGIEENRIRVIKERVGGGYGSKQDILLEEVCAWATWQTGKPVFFRFTREDEFVANSSRHVMKIQVKIGATKEGKFTAVQMDVKANTGPYGNHSLTVPMNGCGKSLPLFMCDNMHFSVVSYYSNISPTGAYQGYGAPKASYALQMAVAELAEVLGLDPLAVIEKNRVQEGDILEIMRCLGEGREGVPTPVKSCGLTAAINEGVDLIQWGNKVVADDPDVKIGKGAVIVQQGSGLPGLDHSGATIKMLGDGTFMLHIGGADIGTGLDTVAVKMAAEVLSVEMDRVSIISGDTDITPFDTGAYASSGTFFTGSAAMLAAQDMRAKILEAAAELLGEQKDALSIHSPGEVAGSSGRINFKTLAQHTQSGEGSGQLIGKASFTTDNFAFPYGAHFCQVAVNTRTGEIHLQKYFALQDCGTPINPELALGQIYGGVLKSIGHTLYEEMVFDDHGRCVNPDLHGYGVPMIGDIPDEFLAKLVLTDDPFGPFGSKSIAEISVNGAAPVIANAIHDAVGVWIREWPLTPEKILRGLGKL